MLPEMHVCIHLSLRAEGEEPTLIEIPRLTSGWHPYFCEKVLSERTSPAGSRGRSAIHPLCRSRPPPRNGPVHRARRGPGSLMDDHKSAFEVAKTMSAAARTFSQWGDGAPAARSVRIEMGAARPERPSRGLFTDACR